MIAEGRYQADVTGWALAETKNGHPQAVVEFQVAEGEFSGSHCALKSGFATDPATEFTFGQLRGAGFTGTRLHELNEIDAPRKRVTIDVKHKQYNGETQVEAVIVTHDPRKFAMKGDAAKKFSAQMEQRLKAFDAKNGTGGGSSAKPANGANPPAGYGRPSNNDDIPF
jgi:hypothetical protein